MAVTRSTSRSVAGAMSRQVRLQPSANRLAGEASCAVRPAGERAMKGTFGEDVYAALLEEVARLSEGKQEEWNDLR